MASVSKYVAGLDLGTNTFNLVICDINKPFPPVYQAEKGVFIGKGGLQNKTILHNAVKRAQLVLKQFSVVLRKYKVNRVKAVATEAIRNAKNGDLILGQLDADISFSIEKISGSREAELIWSAVKASGLLSDKTAMIIDIGGASTEIIIADKKAIRWLKSFKLGVSRALESVPVSDHPTTNELMDLQRNFIRKLPGLKSQLKKYQPQLLIGTAGSFDSWRKILELKDGETFPFYKFETGALRLIIEKINDTPCAERTNIKGIPEIRRKTIVPAGVLVNYLTNIYNFKTVYQCSYSLAEGLMNELIKKQY